MQSIVKTLGHTFEGSSKRDRHLTPRAASIKVRCMHQLTESIGKYLLAAVSPLIRHPENAELRVAATPAGDMLRFRLVLEQEDVARVIGRNGMTASAIRSLAKAAGEKAGTKVVVHILSREEAEA